MTVTPMPIGISPNVFALAWSPRLAIVCKNVHVRTGGDAASKHAVSGFGLPTARWGRRRLILLVSCPCRVVHPPPSTSTCFHPPHPCPSSLRITSPPLLLRCWPLPRTARHGLPRVRTSRPILTRNKSHKTAALLPPYSATCNTTAAAVSPLLPNTIAAAAAWVWRTPIASWLLSPPATCRPLGRREGRAVAPNTWLRTRAPRHFAPRCSSAEIVLLPQTHAHKHGST